ncbi:MAG TPA: nitroreductase family protein [Marmoricola sp.]|nr:nitroreductase family protein [Marmoricola sp.]
MDLYEVMRTTAAVREFTDDPLPDEVLHQILENARFAPSGGNRQGTQIVVVRDADTRERLVEITAPGAKRYHAQRAAGETPWSAYTPSGVTAEQVAQTRVPASVNDPIRKSAVVLVVCVDLRRVAAIDQDLDRVGIVGGASVYPLVWNVLLAARNEGFGGTITTMAVAEEPALKELLGIPDPYAVAAVVPLGRPVKQLTRLTRAQVEDFTHLEHWGGGPIQP